MSQDIPKNPVTYRQWWNENTDVAYGFCWCGCGNCTRIAPRNAFVRSWIKGEPVRYIRNHRVGRKKRLDFGVNRNGGLCHCGCGLPAPMGKSTDRRFGLIKGEPVRFINGHHTMLPESYTVEDRGYRTPCHVFRNAKGDGYGYVGRAGKFIYVHRYFWERENGPVPDGFDLHHECHTRNCVRLDHLTPLSRQEHVVLHAREGGAARKRRARKK